MGPSSSASPVRPFAKGCIPQSRTSIDQSRFLRLLSSDSNGMPPDLYRSHWMHPVMQVSLRPMPVCPREYLFTARLCATSILSFLFLYSVPCSPQSGSPLELKLHLVCLRRVTSSWLYTSAPPHLTVNVGFHHCQAVICAEEVTLHSVLKSSIVLLIPLKFFGDSLHTVLSNSSF